MRFVVSVDNWPSDLTVGRDWVSVLEILDSLYCNCTVDRGDIVAYMVTVRPFWSDYMVSLVHT